MIFIVVITVILNIVVAILSLARNPRSYTNRLLATLSVLLVLWTIANYLSQNTNSDAWAFVWVNTVMLVTSFAGPIFYLFCRTFPGNKLGVNREELFVVISAGLLVFLLVLTGQVFSNVEIVEGSLVLTQSWGIFVYMALLVATLIGGIISIWRKYKNGHGLVKAQARILIYGMGVTFVIQLITNLFLVVFLEDTSATLWGPIFSLILVVSIFYSIARYRFLDIRLATRSLVVRGTSTLLLGFVLWIFYTYLFNIVVPDNLFGALLISILFAMVFVVGFPYVNNLINKAADQYLFVDIREKEVLVSNLVFTLNRNPDLSGVLKDISTFTKKIVNAFEVSYVYKTNSVERSVSGGDNEFPPTLMDSLYEFVNDIVIVNEFLRDASEQQKYEDGYVALIKLLKKSQVEIIAPLLANDKVFGFLLLSPKENSYLYSSFDIKNIKSISEQSALVIRNSLLFEETKEFNKTLQKRIDKATKELALRYDELKQIRAKERDMMDIMGHELRTPLSIIKISLGAIDLTLKNNPDLFTVQFYEDYAKKMKDAISRETELLETMLVSTKIDARRLELSYAKVDLKETIHNSMLGHQESSESKNLAINFDEPEGDLYVYADRVRFGEVVDNFVSNAIKYTNEGHVDISVHDVGDKYRVEIKDTGIGMPEEALGRLGEKFYRVKQYVNAETSKESSNIVRPGGTGLGLYVTFGLVNLMGGEVDVKSKVGEGSVFSFTVPKYTGQNEEEDGPRGKDVFTRMKLSKENGKVISEHDIAEPASSKIQKTGKEKETGLSLEELVSEG
jgi:signal transduction histidine kinase